MFFRFQHLAAIALILGMTGPAAYAAEPMTAEEFDDYTRGKTLFYGHNGRAYGAEIYLDNRRVKWSFLDGECKEGTWYENAGQICFVYEDNDNPQCWSFHKEQGRLMARFENLQTATPLYEADDLGQKLVCLGPEVGV